MCHCDARQPVLQRTELLKSFDRNGDFLRALRLALACLLLKAGDECAQRRLSRLASRCTRRGYGQAHIDLGKAPMARDVSASPDDAIGERDVRFSATELAHLEAP